MATGVDVGKLMRLRGAIQGALNSIPTDQAPVAGRAMADRWRELREEARNVIPAEQLDEFESLFPGGPEGNPGLGLRGQAAMFNEARGLLGSLAGWLEGFIEEARLQAEAEAYGRERAKQERGVGFRAGEQPPNK
jgi:hypothetical protein